VAAGLEQIEHRVGGDKAAHREQSAAQRLAQDEAIGKYSLVLVRRDLAGRREYCGFFRSPTVRNTAIRTAFFHNGVFTSLRDVMHFYVERDLQPQKYYPNNPDGSVHKYDDLPAGFPVNIDRDAPLDRKPGAAPALSESEIDDVIAFLGTLTDGDADPRLPAAAVGGAAASAGVTARTP